MLIQEYLALIGLRMDPDPNKKEKGQKKGSYKTSYEQLDKLVKYQKLEHVAKIIKMDVTKELKSFLICIGYKI